ncbi:natural resistance-associated macrophage protein-domain-containing protein [Phlyctochytrium arcticum]|nr:natural resistance-associated macrophage protein-domain-containing protein [Phlyctochytrium arcticum]
MAVLLQSLCIKLGVVTGRDLAQSCRQYLHPKLNIIFYIFCELAIIATDLAEVIGTAIALNLLFKIPLPIGVVITGLDVLIILAGWNAKHLKYFEWFIMLLMLICGICFATLIGKSNVDWAGVGLGFIPSRALFTESGALYIALGIIGATVMPHNLYLHSSIVKYRGAPASITELGAIRDIDISDGEAERQPLQPLHRKRSLPMTLLMTHVDSIVALTFALTINAAILIVSAANFNNSDDPDQSPAELADAYRLLNKHLGPAAGTLFALALLLAGQSSTITGTMAGQIVMEGFFGSNFGIKPWMRRLVTRSVAIIPAIVVALVKGESGVNQLLVWSQVVLSLQLPFAVWPLVYFTSRKDIMTIRYQVSAHPPSYDHITDAGRRSSSSDSTVVSQSGESDGAESLSDKEEGDQSEEDQGVQVGYGNGRIIMFLAVSVALLITGFNVVLLIQIARGVD